MKPEPTIFTFGAADYGHFRMDWLDKLFGDYGKAVKIERGSKYFADDRPIQLVLATDMEMATVPFDSLGTFNRPLPSCVYDVADALYPKVHMYGIRRTCLIYSRFEDSMMFSFLDTRGFGIVIENRPVFFWDWREIELPKIERLQLPAWVRVF